MFIVLEGIEGCGKSTQVWLLAESLAAVGVSVVTTREPGGTASGERIRDVVLHGVDMPARAELLLMCAARAVHVEEVVRPALSRGDVVICDRYELSTFAYQIHGRGLDDGDVRIVNTFATGGLKPDLTIVLDVDADEAVRRRRASRSGDDRIESAGDAFHTKVAGAYRLLAAADAAVVIIDGRGSTNEVSTRIISVLRERFSETFGGKKG